MNIAFYLSKGADLKGIKVMIRDLDDVLFRDVGGKIAADGRYTAIVLTFYFFKKHWFSSCILDANSAINQSRLDWVYYFGIYLFCFAGGRC